MKKSTEAIHAGAPLHARYGEVSIPIYRTSTLSFPTAEEDASRFAGTNGGYI